MVHVLLCWSGTGGTVALAVVGHGSGRVWAGEAVDHAFEPVFCGTLLSPGVSSFVGGAQGHARKGSQHRKVNKVLCDQHQEGGVRLCSLKEAAYAT